MEIEFYIKNVYGRMYMYILDPLIADTVSRLTGTKTLGEEAKSALTDLGFEFKQVIK